MFMLKPAILIEWMRIFVPIRTRNLFFWVSWILIAVDMMLYACAVLTTFAACQPIQKLWYFWLNGTCINRKTRDIINAAFNLALDAFILLLPQSVIWKLQMSARRRVGISIVFSVGLL
jgi:hypothetical protein